MDLSLENLLIIRMVVQVFNQTSQHGQILKKGREGSEDFLKSILDELIYCYRLDK
jgi:hypothetical protein